MPTDRYHHGDLRRALLDAAIETIAEVGVGSASLRAVARRADVSHAAPAHHFGDRSGLLAALAIEGFDLMRSDLEATFARITEPLPRMMETGIVYIRSAVDRPTHFEVMWQPDLYPDHSAETEAAGLACFALLVDAVRPIAPSSLAEERAQLAWATAHGYAVLLSRGMIDGVGWEAQARQHLSLLGPAISDGRISDGRISD